ncbi:hypothetical protein GN956_G10781 [Arapaima gigas]
MDGVNGFPLGLSWGNGFAEQTADCAPSKRKRSCAENDAQGDAARGTAAQQDQKVYPVHAALNKHRSSFIPIDGNRGVYCSECWEPNGSTLYFPVTGRRLVNMDKYDQITFEQGCFFIGDESGGFQQKAQGQAIHCWRYSEREKKLFISLSYFFSSFHVFEEVVGSLGGL